MAPNVAYTATLSDSELSLLLQKDNQLQNRVQLAATAAHDVTRKLPYAPIEHVDLLWSTAHRRTVEINKGRNRDFPNTAADQAAQVQMLRVALDVIREMQTFASMTPDQRREALPRYRAEAEMRAYNAQHNSIVAQGAATLAATPAWSAAAFVASLARKGVGLAVAPDGGLVATGASQLTAADRELLKSRKALIAAELSATELVA